jgi:hypothetical protein
MLFARRAPKHAVNRGVLPPRRLTALIGSLAVGVGLVIAPIVGVLTASPAEASPPVISPVGALASATSPGGLTTLNDNPVNLGDVLVVVSTQNLKTLTVTSIVGGGVTVWNYAIRYVGVGEPRAYEIWYGVVTMTGPSTITFNLSSPNSGSTAEYEAQEFNAAGLGAGTIWTFDTANTKENASSTTLTYPSLTPARAGELYFGFVDMPSPPNPSGTPAGFTFINTADANQVAYNAVSGAVSPMSSQAVANLSSSVAVLLGVQPPPSVTSISPTGGPAAGGTTVTVTGANFTGATAVNFGTTPGTGLVVNSATSITVTSPANSPSGADVTVVTPEGTSSTSTADVFTYFGVPTVTAVLPSTGSISGGTTVTVTGTNLTGATAVRFGTASGTNVVVNGGGTSLTVTSPAGMVGTVDLTVATPGGTSATSASDHFIYQKSGYWMAGTDGSVFSFGGAPFEGSLPGLGVHVNNIVSIVPTSDSKGYWMIGSDGGVFAFGDAGFVGSLPGLHVTVSNVVGAVPTSTGKGYWMIGSDGGAFAFGDAGFVGSLPGLNIHIKNVVAVVPTATGKGYWMIGSDGGVFAFGDAGFVGSLPGLHVTVSNIVGAVPTSTGKGYWMIGSDGGVFAFGDAGFVGSLPGLNVHVTNVVGVVATSTGKGYWMVGSDGGVFAFGDAPFVGSIPGLGIHVNNIVAFARQ